jgi:uncharacterized protein (TIGR02145 family)
MKVKFSAWLYLTAVILTISNFAVAQTANEVQIGTQIWMTKNLDVSKFRNGDPIPEAKTEEEWEMAGENRQPAWCYYDNDPANGAKYGKLYNWYAVNDDRGLAPEGYYIPVMKDWAILFEFIGGEDTVGYMIKSATGWYEDGNGSDKVGFNGKASGGRSVYGAFGKMSEAAIWWCDDSWSSDNAWYREFNYDEGKVSHHNSGPMGAGFAVRCLREPETVIIGSQEWMTKNLNVEKFRNGDPIPFAPSDAEWQDADLKGTPAWCYNDNDSKNGDKFGKLYNWYAVNDPRGLAPEGYHIPGTLDSLSILAYVPSSKDSAETLLSLVELRQDFKTAEYDLEFAQAISENANYKVFAPDGFSEYPIEIQAEIKQGAKGDVIGPFFQGSSCYLLKISDTSVERAMCRARHILIKDGPESSRRIESFKKIIQQKNNFEDIAKQYSEDPGSGSQGGDIGWFSRDQMVKSFEDLCFNAEIGELNIVQSEYGWHLVEVLGFSTGWKICQIEKMIVPSEETILKAMDLIGRQSAQGEWELLVEFIEGEENNAAGALKSRHGWERGDWCLSNEMLRATFQIENYSPNDFYLSEEFSLDNYNPNGYDEYGYNALPGGWRHNQGIYSSPGTSARFWCRNSTDRENASSRGLDDGPEELNGIALPKGCGLSVRCIKD